MPTASPAPALPIALDLHRAGRLAEAEGLYRQILQAEPSQVDALHFLGVLMQQTGHSDQAIELISRAAALAPECAAIHGNLGEAYRAADQAERAIPCLRRALALRPHFPEALNNLGFALETIGCSAEAVAWLEKAVALAPAMAEAHNNLGNAMASLGRIPEALAAYRRAIALRPSYVEAHDNCGCALQLTHQYEAAIACHESALHLDPANPRAANNLGNALKAIGRMEPAIDAFRRAGGSIKTIAPPNGALAASIQSNLIYSLQFLPHQEEAIAEEQRHWNAVHAAPWRAKTPPHLNTREPGRKLKIGYVSPDFCDHVVGRNVLPLFQHHERTHFAIFCYSQAARKDRLTALFQSCADVWCDCRGLSDDRLAERIRGDGVDILVDLSLHLAGNRLPVLARRPAPVQASFAGYPGSSGVETIAYRISDPWLEPAASDESAGPSAERPLRLPHSFWCFDPLVREPAVSALPAASEGAITFGCLNNICKVNEGGLALWARVLGKVSGSRLRLLSPEGDHRAETLRRLARHGVEAGRVDFLAPAPRPAYLAGYHRLDIVLDTFPYGGHTTTLDALWMGVPVVTLCGGSPVARGGLSILSNLGAPEWVAYTEDQYLQIATGLAGDLGRLASLRAGLRGRLEASPLMDAPRFARDVEALYRTMWRSWCLGSGDHRPPTQT